MNALTPEQTKALDVARGLAAAGVPLFVAPPCPGQTCPRPGHANGKVEFHLPARWQTSRPLVDVVNRWRPGWALCAVMGHRVDLVDVDPRNGGDATRASMMSAGTWPRSYGQAATPSGGTHDFIAPLGVGSHDAVAPGLDVKGGAADGTSRGFAFIAPTVRVSKTTGQPAAYRWIVPPDLSDMEGDDTGRELAAMVEAARRRPTPSAGTFDLPNKPSPWDDIRGALSPEQGGRRRGVLRLACALRGRGGWRPDDAEAFMRATVWPHIDQQQGGHPFTLAEFTATIRDAFNRYDDGSGDRAEQAPDSGDQAPSRRLVLVPASAIRPRRVRWLWQDRVPAGELTLTPGRAGLGKSTFHAWLIAAVTRGTLPGEYQGTPRSCVIAATEDSWPRTIVPRLIAAGADLDRVHRVDVVTSDDGPARLTLPRDVGQLAEVLTEHEVAVLSLDPLLSVISATLDSHKNAEVRGALEPLSRLGDQTGVAVLGNAHFVKGSGNDPLSMVTGSAAFGEVARAALGFAPDDDGGYVLSQIKNNLGRLDLPSLSYVIDSYTVDTDDGPAEVGRLRWTGETDRHVRDMLGGPVAGAERSERDDAKDFLRDLLAAGPVPAKSVRAAVADVGLSWATVRRAAEDIGVRKTHPDIKGPWLWSLPAQGAHQESQDAQGLAPEHLGHLVSTLGDAAGRSPSPETAENHPDSDRVPGCCKGGPVKLQCQLCALSPTYHRKETP